MSDQLPKNQPSYLMTFGIHQTWILELFVLLKITSYRTSGNPFLPLFSSRAKCFDFLQQLLLTPFLRCGFLKGIYRQ